MCPKDAQQNFTRSNLWSRVMSNNPLDTQQPSVSVSPIHPFIRQHMSSASRSPPLSPLRRQPSSMNVPRRPRPWVSLQFFLSFSISCLLTIYCSGNRYDYCTAKSASTTTRSATHCHKAGTPTPAPTQTPWTGHEKETDMTAGASEMRISSLSQYYSHIFVLLQLLFRWRSTKEG